MKKIRPIQTSAKELFLAKTIEGTTMAEIAKEAKIGEATLYRKYRNKKTLATEIATLYMEWLLDGLHTIPTSQSNKENYEALLDFYIEVFKSDPDFFIYLERFDTYMVKEGDYPENFKTYEALLEEIQKYTGEKFGHNKLGRQIIRTYSITFTALCQKLLLRGKIIADDDNQDHLAALGLVKDTFLMYIKQLEGA